MRDKQGRFKKQGFNEVEYVDNYAIIWTTTKSGERNVGYKVDIEDLSHILQYRWSIDTCGYAKCQSLKMHRLIMKAKKGELIDHINQDTTDNRKQNLRFVSKSLNVRNSNKTHNITGYKHIIKMCKKYRVQLKCRGQRYDIGKIETIEDAIKQRNALYEKIKYFEE